MRETLVRRLQSGSNSLWLSTGYREVWVYGVFGVGDVSQIWGVVGGNRQSIIVFS